MSGKIRYDQVNKSNFEADLAKKSQVDALETALGAEESARTTAVSALETSIGNKANKNGDVLEDFSCKNIVVAGNIVHQGDTFESQAEIVQVKDNIMTLNDGEVGEGVTAGTSGIEIDRGTLPKAQFLFTEDTDTFKAGIEGNLKTIATEELVLSKFSKKGSSTFNSTTGRVITHTGGASSEYTVIITPIANPAGNLGEVWVAKGNNTMTVYCSGSNNTTAFDWMVL